MLVTSIKNCLWSYWQFKILICFVLTAVRSVLGMQYKSHLTLKNSTLEVTEMLPLPPPPYIYGPTEPHKLIMIGTPSVTKDELELFLSGSRDNSDEAEMQAVSSNIVVIKRLFYGFQHRSILVEFPSMPGSY